MRETRTGEKPSSAPSAADAAPEEPPRDEVVGESRWPMAGAVVAAMVLTFLLPNGFGFGLFWLFPVIEGGCSSR